jgi:DNA-directed RNA polymerase specialized sigma24 family protein
MSTQGNNSISSTGSNIHDASLRCSAQSAPRKQRHSERRINAAAFERFLYWLGPDPESAGRKYELIRDRLIMMFRARRCVFAEDLADTTFERVAGKLTQITTEFTGDPARYFYGVAKKVFLEYQNELMAKRRRAACSIPTRTEDPNLESMLQQLDDALNAIPGTDRELILTYYTDTGRNKIRQRRALAKQFGIGPNALRLRVFRIRRDIKSSILRGSPDAVMVHKGLQQNYGVCLTNPK